MDNSFCNIADPIYLNADDKLTPDTAKQILAYENMGARVCNWKHF